MSVEQVSNFIFFHHDRLEIVTLIIAFITTHVRSIVASRYFYYIHSPFYVSVLAKRNDSDIVDSFLNVGVYNLLQPFFGKNIAIHKRI